LKRKIGLTLQSDTTLDWLLKNNKNAELAKIIRLLTLFNWIKINGKVGTPFQFSETKWT